MEAKAIETDILLRYSQASAVERVEIMLDKFHYFPKMVHRQQKKTEYKIKSEREYLRSHNRADLGVRVQSSKISDTTAEEAIANVMLEEAFKTGDVSDGQLKGIENAEEYERQIRIISIMKMDYDLLSDLVGDLDDLDNQILSLFLVKKMYIKEIAAETGMSYDYTKRRIKTLKEELTLEVAECIQMNCGEGM